MNNSKKIFTFLFISILSSQAFSATEVDLRDDLGWAGNGNFVGTGGTFRDISQGQDAACSFIADNATSSGILYGIPSGASVAKAHLTWAASGSANDYSVVFNNQTVNAPASRQYTINISDVNADFYSGAADVTSQVQNLVGIASGGSYAFTLSGLDINHTDTQYCDAGRAFGGWTLIVIYELDTDPLRLVNVFEGFDSFWGGSLELEPKNFQVPNVLPDSSINYGKHAHVTWEGDPQISSSRNNFDENLKFQDATLSFLPTNPAGEQYNATIADETLPASTYVTGVYGVDLDVYDISPEVESGLTSVKTVYEAGQDRVFLSSEILSILNVNVADIEIYVGPSSKPIIDRDNDAYIRVNIDNNGPYQSSGELVATVALANDLTIFGSTSFNSNGWSCLPHASLSNNIVCTKDVMIADGGQEFFEIPVYVSATASDNFSVDVSIPGTVDDPYPITGGEFDNVTTNNSSSYIFTVTNGDFSSSVKTVEDVNERVIEPGDTLKYSITLVETSGYSVTGLSIVDNISTELENLQLDVSTIPSGATNASTSSQINLSNFTLAANQTLTVEYTADVLASSSVGTLIDNVAIMTDIEGTSLSPSISVMVSSIFPTSSEKQLYLYSNNSFEAVELSRNRTFTGNQRYVRVSNGNGGCIATPAADNCAVWPLAPNLSADLNINGVALDLLLRNDGGSSYEIDFYLAIVDGSNNVIADLSVLEVVPGTPTNFTYNLNGTGVVSAGDTLKLIVQNNSNDSGKRFRVKPSTSAGAFSQVRIDTDTVINVDSIDFYSVAHQNGESSNFGSLLTSFAPTETVYGRAIVSDPFGTFDISSVEIELSDSNSAIKLSQTNLSQKDKTDVPDLTDAQVLVEFSYSITNSDPLGVWEAMVRADEGSEGVIWDIAFNTFAVVIPPELTIEKQVALASAPAVPITNAQLKDRLQYSFVITNISLGDAVNLVVDENISPYSSLLFLSSSAADDTFVCSDCAAEGISFTNIEPVYSINNDTNFSYTPVPSDDGLGNFVDSNVTNVQIELTGTLEPGKFITFTYQVVVK